MGDRDAHRPVEVLASRSAGFFSKDTRFRGERGAVRGSHGAPLPRRASRRRAPRPPRAFLLCVEPGAREPAGHDTNASASPARARRASPAGAGPRETASSWHGGLFVARRGPRASRGCGLPPRGPGCSCFCGLFVGAAAAPSVGARRPSRGLARLLRSAASLRGFGGAASPRATGRAQRGIASTDAWFFRKTPQTLDRSACRLLSQKKQ